MVINRHSVRISAQAVRFSGKIEEGTFSCK
jgi:hypothetical protein